MSFICIVCRDLLSNKREAVDGAGPASSDIVVTKCGHLYHLACLEDWFNRQLNPRQECPYCKTVLPTSGHQRIFPSGDEETEDLDARMKEAKSEASRAKSEALKATQQTEELKGEINQFEIILSHTGKQLEDCTLSYDILSYEYAQKVSELEESQSQKRDLELMTETIKQNWTEVVDKLTKEKAELEQKLGLMEIQLMGNQQNHHQNNHSQELYDHRHDMLMDTVKRLTDKLDESFTVRNSLNSIKHTRSMGSQTEKLSDNDLDQLLKSLPRPEVLNICAKILQGESRQMSLSSTSSLNGHNPHHARKPVVPERPILQGVNVVKPHGAGIYSPPKRKSSSTSESLSKRVPPPIPAVPDQLEDYPNNVFFVSDEEDDESFRSFQSIQSPL